MSIEITVPKLSATMEEAKVLRWLKQPGDAVREGELLVELETDKAALEVEATASGTLSERKVNEGDTVAVGSVIALPLPSRRKIRRPSLSAPRASRTPPTLQRRQNPQTVPMAPCRVCAVPPPRRPGP
jgi:pyruvate/2-oxoglutarate dehydrogenase complex dihydrolipoamide acyltransferase (E2) component